jgi:hypothetical protein
MKTESLLGKLETSFNLEAVMILKAKFRCSLIMSTNMAGMA